jgi:hypothetical protein
MTVLWEKLLLHPKGFELLFENSNAFFLQIVILAVYPNFILMYVRIENLPIKRGVITNWSEIIN